jgi:SAM-dependent methyltransferase
MQMRDSAPVEGPQWTAKAAGWKAHWSGLADPARKVVAEAAAVGRGTRLLDVGCGTGEFCHFGQERGAVVSGIDASAGMIELARQIVPKADFRVGGMESLPWADNTFDVVTGFNSFQFAADTRAALAEASRVARRNGVVAICNWGPMAQRELFIVLDALREELRQPDQPRPDRPAVGEPGVLEALAQAADLRVQETGTVDVPYEVPDQETLEKALLVDTAHLDVPETDCREAVRAAVSVAAAPFRRTDGSYRFENTFRYLIAAA